MTLWNSRMVMWIRKPLEIGEYSFAGELSVIIHQKVHMEIRGYFTVSELNIT